eukprot:160872_1
MFHIQLLILLFHLNLLIHSHYPSDIGDSDAIIHCSDERDTIDKDHSVSDEINYEDWTTFPIDLQHLFDPKFHRNIATLILILHRKIATLLLILNRDTIRIKIRYAHYIQCTECSNGAVHMDTHCTS